MIILCFLIIGVVAAFITAGALNDGSADGTSTTFSRQCGSGNYTNCGDTSKTTFFDAIRDVSVGSFGSDTPLIVSTLWILAGVFLISAGVIIAVWSFVPTTGF